MYLLDTNVISELRRSKAQPSAPVRAWAAATHANTMYLSAITVLELEMGVLQLERKDPRQGQLLRPWCDAVRAAFHGRILPFTEEAAMLCARMHVPNPKADRDAMIAAIARVHGFTVVTRNTADFSDTGVSLLNPWAHTSQGV